jgi:hypothetical protein
MSPYFNDKLSLFLTEVSFETSEENQLSYTLSLFKKVISKNLLVKSSENNLIFSAAFYLIMCLMKTPKSFEKIVILKIRELVSF